MSYMTQIFYRMFFRSILAAVIIVVTTIESAVACGKYEFMTNTGTCLACRICPININSAQGRIKSSCPESSPSWLLGRFIGCSGRHDPVPWCEPWSDEHGNVTCQYGNMTIGSNCTLQCDNGYEVDVEYASSQCTGNLTWLPTTKPVCRPISSNHSKKGSIEEIDKMRSYTQKGCELWSDEHGNVTCQYGNMTIGSNCTLQCDNGYEVDVEYASSQCTGNLTWLPTTKPVCRPISSNHSKKGSIEEIDKMRSYTQKDDDRVIIGGSVGSSIIILMILVALLCKRFKLSPSKIKEKVCGSPLDPKPSVVEYESQSLENGPQPLMENDGSTKDVQPLKVELPHFDEENIPLNGIDDDANMLVVDELVVPEIPEENADARQLIKVYEATFAMDILRMYFDRKEEKYRVTWHVIAREILHMQSPAIHNLEYHRKGDYSNGPFIAIMEKMKGKGVTLKQILDFLYEFRRNVPRSQEVDYKHINIIIDLLLKFVKK